MKENEKNQQQDIQLPPLWCSAICRNAMNEVCVEHCAIRRDCSYFEIPRDLKLDQLPTFPKTAGMTREEKFTLVVLYLERIVAQLQGTEDEHLLSANHISSIQVSENRMKQMKELLPRISDLTLTLESKVEE